MISVAIASYNGEQYITEQLQSIWNQTLKPDEIVISDDNSSDKTIEIIRNFKETTKAPIRLMQNEKRIGYANNFINALEQSSGEYIFLCDQDDVWEPNKIQNCVKVLQDRKILALATNFSLINEEGNSIPKKQMVPVSLSRLKKISLISFLRYPRYPGMALAMRKELVKEMLQNKKNNIAHDWQLAQLAARNQGLYYYNRSLVRYRLHGNNTLGSIQGKQQVGQKAALQRMKMLQEIYTNVQSLDSLHSIDENYRNKLKQTLHTRIELLKNQSLISLAVYDFFHLKYVSLNSLLGDLYACLNSK